MTNINTLQKMSSVGIAVALLFGMMSITSAQTSTLTCLPATQSTVVGQSVSVTATGGTGTYTWSAPDLNVTNPTGMGFTANYVNPGSKAITVTSGSETATCVVNVSAITTPVIPVTPGLPNTGGGYGR